MVEANDDDMMISKAGCNQTCLNSDVLIPFPFGIGRGCYHDSSEYYEIVCKPSSSNSSSFNNNNNNNKNPFLRKLDIQVFGIGFGFDSYYNQIDDANYSHHSLGIAPQSEKICDKSPIKKYSLKGSPFWFSSYNQFKVHGCKGGVMVRSIRGDIIAACSVSCKHDNNTTNALCNNNNNNNNNILGGCSCLINMAQDNDYYEIHFTDDNNTINSTNTNITGCVHVTYTAVYNGDSSQALLHWKAPRISTPHSEGSTHFHCNRYTCFCKRGFQGNPYLPYGCQAISSGSPKKKVMIIGFSISLGSIFMSFFLYRLFHVIRRRRKMLRRKAIFLRRNGTLLLQQKMIARDNMVDRTKIFSVSELEKATDKFNVNRVLGRGGQGTVYKGMLLDGRVVAIKKALKVDESQIEHFINEVVILSQINHRNIVKLLGCCLETEVPLLVYEFIPNGTLSQHIHNPSEEFYITWNMRLQIAAESAGALTYLHSASATPIYHRDIKSSNILLDEKYRAKVADFGTSRTLIIDQTHLTTLVQGTVGYLDPEYFQTNQLTEKSDVYSFGVVLIELLTGQMAFSALQSGGWKCLTREFLSHMRSSHLFDIVDFRILAEAKKEELLTVASLAKRCLNSNGKHRPTMKEVASILESIRTSTLLDIGEKIYSKVNTEMIMEIGELHEDHYASSSTFYSENNEALGALTSVEVNPLMNYTI